MRMRRVLTACAFAIGGVGGAGNALAQDLTVAATSGALFDAISLTAKEYTELTGVEIEFVEAPYNNLYGKINTNCTTRSGSYDVFMMDDPWAQGFMDNNCLEDLTDYFMADGTTGPDSDFMANSLAVCRNPYATGRYYCLPYVGNAQMFFYDPEAFAEVGLKGPLDTWDKVIEYGGKITAAGGGQKFGYVLRGVEGNPVVAQFMPVFWAHGGQMFDDEGNPQVNGPEVLQALEVFLQLRDISPPGAESMDTDETGNVPLAGRRDVLGQLAELGRNLRGSGAVAGGRQDQAYPHPGRYQGRSPGNRSLDAGHLPGNRITRRSPSTSSSSRPLRISSRRRRWPSAIRRPGSRSLPTPT